MLPSSGTTMKCRMLELSPRIRSPVFMTTVELAPLNVLPAWTNTMSRFDACASAIV